MIENYSLVGPAKIRTLVVPIGQWRRKDFLETVEQFQKRFDIRLVDITPFDDATFNPQGFPQGRLMFDFRTSHMEDDHMLFLHDFEPYRKTFVIIGLVNKELKGDVLETLQKKYPDAISHNLIYFETKASPSKYVFNFSGSSIETIICDIGRNFLEALSHYYSSYKHVTLRSPGAIGGNPILKTTLTRQPATTSASPSSRKISAIEPPTTSGIGRSSSIKSLGRITASPDHQRSKARQAKILGNFQLLAGRYMDALHSFSEAASTLYKHHDYIWLGNALEGLSISIVLLTYLQAPFQVPQIVTFLCQLKGTSQSVSTTPPPGRDSFSGTPVQSPRNSLSSFSTRGRILDAQDVLIPSVIKSLSERVLFFYELSLSHNTEYTPQLVYCEHILRMLQFMTSCHLGHGFDQQVLKHIVLNVPFEENKELNCSLDLEPFSKLEIYQFANKLFELQLKEMDIISQVKIYTSLASVYESLKLHRKRCFILRILFVSLMSNLNKEEINANWKKHYGIMINALLHTYGIDRTPETCILDAANCSWVTLQKSILMLCVSMASKDCDTGKMREFSLLLLKRYSHVLTQAEEIRLLKEFILPSISKPPTIEYWDPFLVRNLQIMQLDVNKEMPQEKRISSSKTSKSPSESPVFNPFRQISSKSIIDLSKSKARNESFLRGETAELILTLQNPFKFSLEITSLSFVAEDEQVVSFLKDVMSTELPFIVPSNSLRSIHLPVVFMEETKDKAHKIECMRVGLFGLPPQTMRIVASEKYQSDEQENFGNERCVYGAFQFRVIPEGPELEFVSSSLNDNTCMMLDGTKKVFSFIVRNSSLSCSANYLALSHITSVEKALKTDYWKKLPLDDLYEIETQMRWLQLKCITFNQPPQTILPNSSVEIQVEVDMTGAPFQFTGFEILLEYGMKRDTNSDVLYTKILRVPFDITLKRSIEVPNMDVIPLTETFAVDDDALDCTTYLMDKVNESGEQISDYALMLLDIRNSWLHDVSLMIEYDDFFGSPVTIESKHTTRIVVPVKRFLPTSNLKNKEIPQLVTGRQFVNSGITRDQTADMREKFWCREAILDKLSCKWKLHDALNTTGSVDFRQFLEKIDTRTLDILYPHRGASYGVALSVCKEVVKVGEALPVKASISVNARHTDDEPLSIVFLLFNRRTGKPIPKSSSTLLYNGKLSRQVRPKHNHITILELLPLERGEYEVACCLNSSQFNDVPLYFRVQ